MFANEGTIRIDICFLQWSSLSWCMSYWLDLSDLQVVSVLTIKYVIQILMLPTAD